MSEITQHVWLNGEIVPQALASPSVASLSLNLGMGVFDGLMAYWNDDHYCLHRAEEHLERLRRGAQTMSMPLGWGTDDLLRGVQQLLDSEPRRTYYIRPIVFRAGPELFITGAEAVRPDVCIYGVKVGRDSDDALKCCVSTVERVSSRAMPTHCKVCGIYVNSYFTRKEAELKGFDDGLMLDRNGRITEASAANVFFIEGERLITPEITPEILPGITRRVVLEIARELKIATAERTVLANEIGNFDGAFLCATLMELRPISCIENVDYPTIESPLFRQVLDAFRHLTHQ